MRNLNTQRYENTHGTKPRGNARWWFEMTVEEVDGAVCVEQMPAQGTLRNAAKEAKQAVLSTFPNGRVTEITVLP